MDQVFHFSTELFAWMQSNFSLTILILSGILMPIAVAGLVFQLERRPTRDEFQALETRLLRMSAALELLTDTTESGLKSAFGEIERLGGATAQVSGRADIRTRIAQAVQLGRSVREIAQAEGVSESEVQLHVRLQQSAAGQSAPRGDMSAAPSSTTVISRS